MTQTKTIDEVLANLQGKTRAKPEKFATIEASLQSIIDAKRRNVSFRSIAQALAEAGIEIHHETLRQFVTKHQRYLEAFPKASERSSTPSKDRQSRKRASKERTAEKPPQDANQKQADPRNEPAAVVSSPPKPTTNPNDFAGIRRLNARK